MIMKLELSMECELRSEKSEVGRRLRALRCSKLQQVQTSLNIAVYM